MNEETETYKQLLAIVNSVQDFGVCGGMGDLVKNETVAKALFEQGCVVVKTIPQRRSYNGRKQD